MPDFSSLPSKYQHVLSLAQEQHGFVVTPLEELKGGRTEARLYLVSVSFSGVPHIEHYVLKIDRINEKAKLNEIRRHKLAQTQAPAQFVHQHMAEIAYEVLYGGVIAIFYTIAGQSLHKFHPLAFYKQQSQQEKIFTSTNDYLLEVWNEGLEFKQAIHPQSVLSRWLGYRLRSEGNIAKYLREELGFNQGFAGMLIQDQVYPNPFLYAQQADQWADARSIDTIVGFQHGDLNIGNILVKFTKGGLELDGYFLIDFSLYKPEMPLLYDQRYLEMSYLISELERVDLPKWIELVTQFAIQDIPDPKQVPVELVGTCAVINAGRKAFKRWVKRYHPSLADDLWGQFWLAAVAIGLNYCNKKWMTQEERLAGLIFAAAHLKRYFVQFGVPLPEEVSSLYDSSKIRTPGRGDGIAPNLREPFNNLPTQPTEFIGRREEVLEVSDILLQDNVHLLTLYGPGGTGKTRLGIQVAEALLDEFKDGVIFVPLADIRDPDLVISKIAQLIGVREGGSQSLMEIMKSLLRDKQLLLMLDNFEQVIDAALYIADLIAGVLNIKVLVTSRKLLNLQGEFAYFVPPLKLPESSENITPEILSQYEAVQLFVSRARTAKSHFSLTSDNSLAIARICQRLEGLPLAIELAAARVRLLSPQDMLIRLSDRFMLLSRGARDLPARQQTLRATLDWSYDLLDEDERILFTRLGVFVGGFTLDAAESVCNVNNELDVVGGIDVLINNSLLHQEESYTDHIRFRMLETIREYALERLELRSETQYLRQLHANFYTERMSELATSGKVHTSEGSFWLEWIEREYDNLRSVLAWSQSDENSFWIGPIAIMALYWFWYRRGYFSEGRDWCQRILASPAAEGHTQARVISLLFSGIMAMWQGDLAVAQTLIDEGLDVSQRLEEDLPIAVSFLFSGFVMLNQGDDLNARYVLEQALALFREMNMRWEEADTLVHLGNADLGFGELEKANNRIQEAEKISREVGDNWLIAFALNNYGEVARVNGDYAQAGAYYRESESLLRLEGDKGGDLARLIHSLGYVALREGDKEAAENLFHESLDMFRNLGNKRGIGECLAGLAGVWVEQGEPQRAAKLLSAAYAMLSTSGQSWWPADRVEYERTLKNIQDCLDEEAFNSAWSEGGWMDLESAIAYTVS